LTRGKPWSADEVRRLRDLMKSGVSIHAIAKAMGKTVESVQLKVMRLGLIDEGAVYTVPSSSTSSTTPEDGLDKVKPSSESFSPVLGPIQELPTVEEVLKKLAAALVALEQPGLSRYETLRYKTLIQGAEKYEKLYVNFAKYKSVEGRLIELEEKYFELVKKRQTS
jgi:hypothetical protein